MSDFTSSFWSSWIIVLTLAGIAFCVAILRAMSKRPDDKEGPAEVTGHVWDENLEELNNPLPMWWLRLFYITIIFGVGYLILYPGLGTYAGLLHWTSTGSYVAESQAVDEAVKPLFDKYAAMDIEKIAHDPEARAIGQRLFLNNCAQCHGSDGGGQKGFPNLRDTDWLWGGEPARIEETITQGRQGQMPAWVEALGETGVQNVAYYVLSFSRPLPDDKKALAAQGEATFKGICAACHGPEGKGNPAVGAPNLTDTVWLYGGSEKDVMETIRHGRHGVMPAHKDRLSPAHIHLLAGYVYGFSHP